MASELPSIFLFTTNQYLIPDIEPYNSSYNKKYELALINDGELFINEYGNFFSRIYKKNGCHRYYITSIVEEIATSMDGGEPIFYKFSSLYLGNNLEISIKIFLSDDIYSESSVSNDDTDNSDDTYFAFDMSLLYFRIPFNTSSRFIQRTQ